MVHHGRGLRRLLKDDELFDSVTDDWRRADLDERRRAMVAYAVKLTETPAAVAEHDIDVLRDVGFSDVDILQICEVTAYYAYVNRIADGLGVQLETWLG